MAALLRAGVEMRVLGILPIVGGMLLGSPARAEDGTGTPAPAVAAHAVKRESPRGYVGLSLGAGSITIDHTGVSSSHLVDATYSIFGGNFLFKYLSIEYGLATLGNYSADYQLTSGAFNASEHHEIKFDRSAFVALVGWLPERVSQKAKLPADLRLYGKVGGSYWHAKLQMSGQLFESGTFLNSYGSNGEGSGISPLYGLGLDYRIGVHAAVRLDWTIFSRVGQGTKVQMSDGTQSSYGGKSVAVVGLGVVYSY